MQYKSKNPKGKTRGMSASILPIKRGIAIFMPLVSIDTINMFSALKNCMNVCPRLRGTVK